MFWRNHRQWMVLSKYGKIVNQYWLEIPEHFPNAKLDEYIIMPNHLHRILIIKDNVVVGNRYACPLHNMGNKRQYKKLPVIIGLFKSAVTKQINQVRNETFFCLAKIILRSYNPE